MPCAAVTIVERYIFELYNSKNVDLVHDICADPMARHTAGDISYLTREQQITRIAADFAAHDPRFSVVTLVGDDEYASLTWDAERLTTGEKLCGIEIFKVQSGLITDVWNSNYFEGSWS